jgi:hypothetical protein
VNISFKNSAYNIAHMAQLKSSSVLTYETFNYSSTNVVDRNPATSPDDCNCCWSSADETNPWLEVTLPRHEHLVDIVLQGRTDQTDGNLQQYYLITIILFKLYQLSYENEFVQIIQRQLLK